MKKTTTLTTLFFFLVLVKSFGQIDSIKYYIKNLVTEFNNLPKTNIDEIAGVKFQYKHKMEYVFPENFIQITTEYYRPNSNEKTGEVTTFDFFLKDLHINSLRRLDDFNNSNIFLQLFTSNNDYKIKVNFYDDGVFKLGQQIDRVSVGRWHKDSINQPLLEIETYFNKLLFIYSDSSKFTKPNFNIEIDWQKANPGRKIEKKSASSESSVLINSAITKPALFLKAKTIEENKIELKKYILAELAKKNIQFKGKYGALITIDENGNIKNVNSYKLNTVIIEDIINQILNNMPAWEPGFHNNQKVAIGEQISILE